MVGNTEPAVHGTLLIAQLTPLSPALCSQPQTSDLLALPQTLPYPSPLAGLTLWNTLCSRQGLEFGALSASTAGWSPGSSYHRGWEAVLLEAVQHCC